MPRKLPTYFDEGSSPVEHRIATGLHKLALAMKHEAWHRASGQGLSPTQAQILSTLSLDGPQTGSELAKRLGLTLPTISDSASSLVQKDLVEKKPDPRNGRASLIELTIAGRSHAELTRTWPDYLASAVGTLSHPEQEVFLGGLVKMIRSLQEDGRIPTSRMCVTCVHFRPNVHEGPLPHHCAFVDAPMANRHLRVDCSEHEEAPEAARASAWERFVRTG